VIDIHTHLLPGVDDGSPNADHSAVVIARLHSEGVSAIVCTPHVNASSAGEAPFEEHAELLSRLRELVPASVALHSGFEIMLDSSNFNLGDARLGLAGSRARLVEFPRRGLPTNATEQLLRVRSQGAIPVIAHPERYLGCTTATIAEWRELGAVIQCDAMGLLGSSPMTGFARDMLASGLVDIIASDNHGDRRSQSIAVLWLSEFASEGQAELMTNQNPGLLLAGEPLRPVPPISFQKGMFERLKEIIFQSARRPPTAGRSP
jgi:protein-tyrosine phosphatase